MLSEAGPSRRAHSRPSRNHGSIRASAETWGRGVDGSVGPDRGPRSSRRRSSNPLRRPNPLACIRAVNRSKVPTGSSRPSARSARSRRTASSCGSDNIGTESRFPRGVPNSARRSQTAVASGTPTERIHKGAASGGGPRSSPAARPIPARTGRRSGAIGPASSNRITVGRASDLRRCRKLAMISPIENPRPWNPSRTPARSALATACGPASARSGIERVRGRAPPVSRRIVSVHCRTAKRAIVEVPEPGGPLMIPPPGRSGRADPSSSHRRTRSTSW